jgi:peroxiredoxin
MLGTAKERQAGDAPERADGLAELTLPDHEGNQVRLSELWRERPAALVWLRHYGCVHCRDHAVQLDRARQEFEDAGVALALIGHGTPEQAAAFRDSLRIGLPVLADRRRESYRAAGTKVATMGEMLGPKSVSKGLAATLRSAGRIRQGKVIGHPAQLGGVLVVQPDGEVSWSHIAENAGDNATPEDILEAARPA